MFLNKNQGKTDILVALITGAFLVIGAIIGSEHFFPKPKDPETEQSDTPSDANFVPDITVLISKAIRDLEATRNNSYDLATRLSAIRSLQMTGKSTTDTEIKKMITSELQRYIKNNLAKRKSKGMGIQEDRGTFRADDIIASIEALQTIRRSSGNRIKIDLSNLNFNHVNLVNLDLEGVNFAYSTFRHAFLSGSNMKDTTFNFADLSHAAIWNADMSNAKFHKAVLQGAKFANVQLSGSNIEEAKDKSVVLFGAKGLRKDQIILFPRFDGK